MAYSPNTIVTDPTTPANQQKVSSGGSAQVQIASADGTLTAGISAYNRLRVSPEGTSQFVDHFDLIDVNKWLATSANGGSYSYGSGSLLLTTSTTANAQSMFTSVPSFEQQGNVYLEFGCNIKVEAAPLANVYRFWGLATSPSGGSTYANPIQDGIGFELSGSVFQAVMYSGGTKTFSQTLTLLTDGAQHRYAFFFNTQFQYFYQQSLDVPVASSSIGLTLTTQILPLKLLMINNSTAPSSAPTFQMGAIAITDLGRNNTAISDGTYAFRKAQVNDRGSLQISGEGGDGRVRTGQESMLFFDAIEGTVINSNLWGQKTSGMTITQGSALQNLNANGNLASGSYAIMQSLKYMPLLIEFPLYGQFRAKVAPQVNAIVEIGFINIGANTAAPNDGCFFRWDATGKGYAVISFAGTETLTALPITTVSTYLYNFEITISEDHVRFEAASTTANSQSFGFDVDLPGSQGSVLSVTHIQAAARVYNTGTVTTAASITISGVNVQQQDLAASRPFRDQLAIAAARGSHLLPVSPYTTTSNLTNNVATASATLSNTTPSYSTLGGAFLFTIPAGSDTADFALFGFQVPAGYQLHITEVTINSAVGTTNSGGTILQWSLGLNSTGASLATAESPSTGTAAPRRLPLGQQGFTSNANLVGVGVEVNPVSVTFDPGICCDSGRYLHLILRIPISTAGGTIRGMASIRGYFE